MENYEKKYKEALERARLLKLANPDDEAIQTFVKDSFPELKESEDERIRKGIISGMKALQEKGNYTFANIPMDNVFTWLEKQQEQKPAEWKPQPESLEALMYAIEGKWDMIPPTSYLSRRLEDLYEGLVNTYRVDESLVTELHKAASEEDIEALKELKRKIDASMEKPVEKPAEYLSKEKVFAIMNKLTSLSFCVPLGSDEEKKIHEITCDVSSLLDYPIEQKSAEWSEDDETMIEQIKFAVMQMPSDREDTKIECLAYLEKQKESLHISELCKENANSFTDEDERIRKWIIEEFKIHYDFESKSLNPMVEKALAWLEKQKEQKPIQSEDEKEYVRTLKGLVSDFIRDCGGGITDIGYYQQVYDWLDGRHVEQKPITINQNEKEFLADEITAFLCNYDKEFDDEDPVPSEVAELFYLLGKQAQEQKPIEWSEEDKDNLCRVIRVLEDNDSDWEELSNWLKSLRPQSEVEWSNEDEHRCGDAIYFLETAKKHYADTSEIELTIEWLKSLQPQAKQEWSEDDKFKLEDAITGIDVGIGFYEREGKHPNLLKAIIEAKEGLKSLRPQSKVILKEKDAWCCSVAWACVRDSEVYTGKEKEYIRQFLDRCNPVSQPHWKPSEEQMNSLHDTIVNTKGYQYSVYLPELYEQLKKLM